MTEQYVPTTNEVLWAWAEWRRPFLERDNWFPSAASLREASNAEFQRWLAKHDAEVAAKAWTEGYKLTPMTDDAEIVEMLNPYRKEKNGGRTE